MLVLGDDGGILLGNHIVEILDGIDKYTVIICPLICLWGLLFWEFSVKELITRAL